MNLRRRTLDAMLPLALLAGLASAAQGAPPPGAAVVPRSLDIPGGALVAPGKAPELDLLYTGDVIGYIDPCG